jgi:hypothetical protein
MPMTRQDELREAGVHRRGGLLRDARLHMAEPGVGGATPASHGRSLSAHLH